MPNRFDLEKTWRSSGNGVFNFTSSGNVTLPFGKQYTTVTGKGPDGNAPTGGTPNAPNAPTGGTPAAPNPATPGTPNAPNAPTGGTPKAPNAPTGGTPKAPNAPTGGTPNAPNAPTGGTPTAPNAPTAGTPTAPNATTPGTPTASNPTTPGGAGTPTVVLGVTFPGGASGGGTAPTIPKTEINYYNYPDNTTYPVTIVGTGASITVEID